MKYNMLEYGHYAQWENPNTKEQILCESTYVRYLESSNS